MSDGIICRCGHKKEEHAWDDNSTSHACIVGGDVWATNWADNCMVYTPDNLLYIETLAKEKGLV